MFIVSNVQILGLYKRFRRFITPVHSCIVNEMGAFTAKGLIIYFFYAAYVI